MIRTTVKQVSILAVMAGVIGICSACSGGSAGQDTDEVPLFTDILSLEVVIEDDPTLGDFQIVDPSGDIAVDAAGNIYLPDEYTLKVTAVPLSSTCTPATDCPAIE